MPPTLTNWAGNITYRPADIHRPTTVSELQRLVAESRAVRPVGTRHSFNHLADSAGIMVSAEAIDLPIEIDTQSSSVTVGAGTRYAELAQHLDDAGFALHNLGSLPHISVAGACATGTHGSGDLNGNLATAVSAVELVTADGSLAALHRDVESGVESDGGFAGAVVSLGLLGVVVRVTLDVVPAFGVRQWVFDDLAWPNLVAHLDEVFAAGYSVSAFTRWRDNLIDQVWVKRLADHGEPGEELFGARLADGPRHPIPGMPAENCTEQGGVAGSWRERLPHFRAEFTPSAGDELQSEYLVSRDHAVDALEALRGVSGEIAPVLHISELRTVAADDLWLSPAYGRDSLAVHFTWHKNWPAIRPVLGIIEQVLAPFDARPHWGKLFTTPPEVVRSRYPRLPDFVELAREHDPYGTFRNDFVSPYID